jgi:hypothetical protein
VLLARRTHAPGLRFRLPGIKGAEPFVGSNEFFDFAQRGRLELFLRSGVHIDARGRINLHVLGDYRRPDGWCSTPITPASRSRACA